MEQAKPVLMEPVYNLDVYCAESMMGDVIGDLNSKRGRILGMQSLEDGMGCVKRRFLMPRFPNMRLTCVL